MGSAGDAVCLEEVLGGGLSIIQRVTVPTRLILPAVGEYAFRTSHVLCTEGKDTVLGATLSRIEPKYRGSVKPHRGPQRVPRGRKMRSRAGVLLYFKFEFHWHIVRIMRA